MADFYERQSKESTPSRYIQQNVPSEEGNDSRIGGPSAGKPIPEDNIQIDSAGGEISEKELTPELGEYGKVRVVAETHKGNVILLDETDDNERVFLLHPKGSYLNIDTTGDKTDKTEGHSYTLTSKEWKIEVGENRITFVHGDETITIDKNRNVDVGENENITIGGNKTDDVGGNESRTISGNKTDDIGGNLTISVGGNVSIDAGGNVSVTSGGPTSVSSGGPVTITGPTISLN